MTRRGHSSQQDLEQQPDSSQSTTRDQWTTRPPTQRQIYFNPIPGAIGSSGVTSDRRFTDRGAIDEQGLSCLMVLTRAGPTPARLALGLMKLESDPMQLSRELDWVIRRRGSTSSWTATAGRQRLLGDRLRMSETSSGDRDGLVLRRCRARWASRREQGTLNTRTRRVAGGAGSCLLSGRPSHRL